MAKYWVGGTGNWSDATNHWATSSGGSPGVGNIPTSSDNVYFDANSFSAPSQTVTIDATAYCADMDWTGATNTPAFASVNDLHTPVGDLHISGNLLLISGIITTGFIGSWYFDGTSGVEKTITTNGVALALSSGGAGGIRFYTANSNYKLLDNLDVGIQTIYYKYGTLNTNGKTVSCGSFYSNFTTTRNLILGSSTINCLDNAAHNTQWLMNSSNLTLDAGTSTIKLYGVGNFVGAGKTYYSLELNGTAHTVSGVNTFTNLIRTGTATITDTLTFANNQTVTGSLSFIGNSVVNILNVNSSVGGTVRTITVTGATITKTNVILTDVGLSRTISLSVVSFLLSFKDAIVKYWVKPTRTSTSYSNNSKNSSTFTQNLRHGKEPSMSDLENYTFQSVVFDSGETLEDITFAELQDIVWTNINKSS